MTRQAHRIIRAIGVKVALDPMPCYVLVMLRDPITLRCAASILFIVQAWMFFAAGWQEPESERRMLAFIASILLACAVVSWSFSILMYAR